MRQRSIALKSVFSREACEALSLSPSHRESQRQGPKPDQSPHSPTIRLWSRFGVSGENVGPDGPVALKPAEHGQCAARSGNCTFLALLAALVGGATGFALGTVVAGAAAPTSFGRWQPASYIARPGEEQARRVTREDQYDIRYRVVWAGED
jgi:hypothetical protein